MFPALFWYDTYYYIIMISPNLNPPTISYLMRYGPTAAIAGIPIVVGWGHCDSFADRAPVVFQQVVRPSNEFRSFAYSMDAAPQWWSRRGPPEHAPRHQKVALCIFSLHVHALPLRV